MRCIWIISLLIFGFGCQSFAGTSEVCLHGVCFEVEVVQSPEAVQRGLQHREYLPVNHGMLFVFPESFPYSFWMKDTLIPLDMIWLDENRKVVYIVSSASLCPSGECVSYTPPHPARYVLEVNAGLVNKIGIKEGDTAEFYLN
jgi:uncharacterized membrane protein (UPF0127 family)